MTPQNSLVDEAIEYVRALYQGNSDGHGFDHTMRVYRAAMRIAEKEGGCDPTVTALAALLHDADDHKLFSTEDHANARAFLAGRVDAATEARVIDAVSAVSFSRNQGKRPGTPEGRVVQDADRLDAIGAVGIARTFAYGGKHGRALTDSIGHFHDKLLKLQGLMNTDTARALAARRHAFMEDFLREWDEETGCAGAALPDHGDPVSE